MTRSMSEPWEGAYVDAVRWASRQNPFSIEIKRVSTGVFAGANWSAILSSGNTDEAVWRESCIMRWSQLSTTCRFWQIPTFLADGVVGCWVTGDGGCSSLLRVSDGKLQMANPANESFTHLVSMWRDASMRDPNERGVLRYYPENHLVTWEDYIQ
jgi:hypothetical protein